jgi:dipeptidase E
MKLLLTSNGFIENSLEKDFLDLIGNRTNLKVAVIPTAGDPIEWVPETEGSTTYVAKLTHPNDAEYGKGKDYFYFKNKGFEVIVSDLKENPELLRKKLAGVDVIDVLGGDVNYLLECAKRAKLDAYLQELLEKGVVYVGSSAGSALVTRDIGLTWWEPAMRDDHIGFGIVDFVVVPHQSENDKEKAVGNLIERKKYMQSVTDFPWAVYVLQDGQAVKVDGDKIEHIGEGAKAMI